MTADAFDRYQKAWDSWLHLVDLRAELPKHDLSGDRYRLRSQILEAEALTSRTLEALIRLNHRRHKSE